MSDDLIVFTFDDESANQLSPAKVAELAELYRHLRDKDGVSSEPDQRLIENILRHVATAARISGFIEEDRAPDTLDKLADWVDQGRELLNDSMNRYRLMLVLSEGRDSANFRARTKRFVDFESALAEIRDLALSAHRRPGPRLARGRGRPRGAVSKSTADLRAAYDEAARLAYLLFREKKIQVGRWEKTEQGLRPVSARRHTNAIARFSFEILRAVFPDREGLGETVHNLMLEDAKRLDRN